jgi:hypothetical protein
MRFSPSIVPPGAGGADVYLVLDQLGHRLGRVWRETDEEYSSDRSRKRFVVRLNI